MGKKGAITFAQRNILERDSATFARLSANQREFAMRANLKENRYSQYETGVRPLTIEAALVSASNTASPLIGSIAAIARRLHIASQIEIARLEVGAL